MRVTATFKMVCLFLSAFFGLFCSSCNAQKPLLLKYTSAVRAILEDSNGNIWFGSYSEGACLFRNGTFQYFTTNNGLSNNQVRSIYEDKNGVIWFECGNGVSTYDGNHMTIYTNRNYVSPNKWNVHEGDLWFKGNEHEGYNAFEAHPGVYQYSGQGLSYRHFPVAQKPGDGFKYYISTPFVTGKNGTVWFGTYGAVIGCNGSAFTILDNAKLGLNDTTGLLHVRSLLEDRNGTLWIGNNGMGVLKYDGKHVMHFTAQQKARKKDTNGNSLERVFAVAEDGAGTIWFGTVGSGAWSYDGTSLKNYTATDGLLSNHIWTIYKSNDGTMWFGGEGGVFAFNGSRFSRKF